MDSLQPYKSLDAYFEIATLLDGTPSNNLRFQIKLVDLFKSIEEEAYSKGFNAALEIKLKDR